MKFKLADPLPPGPEERGGHSINRMIDNLVGLLTESSLLEHNPEEEKALGEAMMQSLKKELDERDEERRKLWGNRYPAKLYQKPPKGYVPSPPPVNRVNGVVAGGGMAEVGRGKGEEKENGRGKKSKMGTGTAKVRSKR